MKKLLSISAGFVLSLALLSFVIISCKKEKTTSCPTTAACGCSSKSQSECNSSTDCCKWTTGSGCGCK
ncbi:MAG: hypothetical protein Q8T03_05490 [Bacteroidota bacterium]|nr:hypothetical protein [Bacteroidota bacterium]